MSITKSVGHKGVNLPQDVKTVQILLNKALEIHSEYRNKQSAIEVNSQCDDKTKTAIGVFQSVVLKFQYPDKRVDPGGQTWKELNQNNLTTLQLHANTALAKPDADNFNSWFSFSAGDELLTKIGQYVDEVFDYFNFDDEPEETKPKAAVVRTAPKVTTYRQGDKRWGKTKLGFSKTGSIHGYGCAMTSLTMAATYLGSSTKHWEKNQTPKTLTPLVVNNIFKKAKVFTAKSYMLMITGGAKALGMNADDSGIAKKLTKDAVVSIDKHLSSGGLALAHVDYKKDWKGDHWILLTHKTADGVYKAIDPAYGKTINLYASPDQGKKSYKHAVLYGRRISAGAKTPKNVSGYKVVRYVTLAAGGSE